MRRLAIRLLAASLLIAPAPAFALFHFYIINEIYSNASGTIQYVELTALAGSQQFVSGHSLTSTSGTTKTFTVPSDLPGDTSGRRMLFGTAGVSAAFGLTPDYIIPDGFLFLAGGTLNWGESSDIWNHPAIPTNGMSLNRASGNVITTGPPTPQNFAGVVGAPATRHSDFNADFRSDILWRDTLPTGYVYEWQMNGLTVVNQGYLPTVPSSWTPVGIGDIDGDGKADVFWREETGLDYLWTMNGLALGPTAGYLPTVPVGWNVVGIGDADGDGKADVFFRNPGTGEMYLWLMNGLTLVGQGYLPTVTGADWEVVGVADVSGDGKADVLWRNNISGLNYLWIMNGLTVSSQGYLPSVPDTNWEIVGTPDANADRKADVFWRNKSTGDTYLWIMDGLVVTSQGFMPTVADNNWKVMGYGDYDGDGRGDIFWRNAVTGQTYLWTLNGLTVATQGYLPTVTGANWVPIKR